MVLGMWLQDTGVGAGERAGGPASVTSSENANLRVRELATDVGNVHICATGNYPFARGLS